MAVSFRGCRVYLIRNATSPTANRWGNGSTLSTHCQTLISRQFQARVNFGESACENPIYEMRW